MTRTDTLHSEIVLIPIEEEIKRSYLDYAMSVIVGRALPDVRDGLKPVHRRILYAMKEIGFDHTKPHRKSANVVGQVIAKYHPHGTDPIYGAMVRMAQPFAMRNCLVDGHGNFGSVDGDKAASMRYTEARLSALSHYMLEDYDKNTVDFQPNYDGTQEMPTVLPARFPNLLVNGANGIAVGMATNIPCHNLNEVLEACCLLIDEPQSTLDDLLTIIQGPDFSTGGSILGVSGIREAYRTGKGSFTIRAVCHIEEYGKDREAIIITQIPYQVNKSAMIEHMASLVDSKTIEGISEIRDESNRHGIRIVIELKRDAVGLVVLNHLYSMTELQISFSANMLALNHGRPVQMPLKDILDAFLSFRKEVIIRRTQFYLQKDRQRAHILMGLLVAISHIDEVIHIIKNARDTQDALEKLMARTWSGQSILASYLSILDTPCPENLEAYQLSEEQTRAILALRLHRLTGMEKEKLLSELDEVKQDVLESLALLSSDERIFSLMKQEFQEIKTMFPTPRLTSIEGELIQHAKEDFIACEDMVVTVTLNGYIKRVPLETYRSQRRGGRGKQAMATRPEDAVSQIFIADTHTVLLFFTSRGKAYQLKVHELPLALSMARGKPLVTFFPLDEGETLATLLPLPRSEIWESIVFATSSGTVRKNALSDFCAIRANGKNAMKLGEQERLIGVALANGDYDVLLTSHCGKSIRFPVKELRQFSSRDSTGVRGMSLKDGDSVVSMSLLRSAPWSPEEIETYTRYKAFHRKNDDMLNLEDLASTITEPENLSEIEAQEEFILCVTDQGFGKRTSSYAYRRIGRGGQGVATMDTTTRTGHVINALPVKEDDHILMLTNLGKLLRCPVKEIRISGRKTQGVRVFRLEDQERIVSVAALNQESEDEESLQDTTLPSDLDTNI